MAARLARMRISRALVQNTALMYGAAVTAGAVQYAVLVIVARTLGPNHLGVVVLATTVASLMAAALELGVSPVLIRFRTVEKDDSKLWSAIVRSMARIVTFIAVGMAGLALLVLVIAATDPRLRVEMTTAAFALGIAAPTGLFTFCQGYLVSYSRFGTIALLNVGMAVMRLAVIAALAAAGRLTATTALAIYLLTVCGAAALSWRVTLGQANLPHVGRRARKRARMLVAPYLRWTMLGRATVALVGRLDIFLTSLIAGATTTGIYGVASQSAAPFGMLATAVGEVSFPHLVAQEKKGDGRAAIRRWLRWLPVLAVGGSALAVGGAYILPRIMGARFQAATEPFVVLMIAYSFQVWLQPVGVFLYASDRQRRAVFIAVGQTIVVTALDVVLIPRYGALGPALAILIMTCAAAPVMVAAALRQRRGGPDVLDLSAPNET